MTKQEIIEKYKDKAIHCDTKEKANKLLSYLDSKWFKWFDGSKLNLRSDYFVYKSETCYKLGFKGRLAFASKVDYEESDYETITFEEFMKGVEMMCTFNEETLNALEKLETLEETFNKFLKDEFMFTEVHEETLGDIEEIKAYIKSRGCKHEL